MHLLAGLATGTLRRNPVPRASQVSPGRTEIPSMTNAPSRKQQQNKSSPGSDGGHHRPTSEARTQEVDSLQSPRPPARLQVRPGNVGGTCNLTRVPPLRCCEASTTPPRKTNWHNADKLAFFRFACLANSFCPRARFCSARCYTMCSRFYGYTRILSRLSPTI